MFQRCRNCNQTTNHTKIKKARSANREFSIVACAVCDSRSAKCVTCDYSLPFKGFTLPSFFRRKMGTHVETCANNTEQLRNEEHLQEPTMSDNADTSFSVENDDDNAINAVKGPSITSQVLVDSSTSLNLDEHPSQCYVQMEIDMYHQHNQFLVDSAAPVGNPVTKRICSV